MILSKRVKSGAGGPTRTGDLLITNQLLYQLSYAGFLGGTQTIDTSIREADPVAIQNKPGTSSQATLEIRGS